jgi:antirestriction protein ArdC
MSSLVANTEASFNLAETLWESMEAGLAPWQKTWHGGAAPGRPANISSGKAYRSGNSLYLMMQAVKNGWSNQWISFVETNKLGGSLKGQKGTKIEVPLIKKEVDKSTGIEKEFCRGFRTAVVFNVDQVQGIELSTQTPDNPIEAVPLMEKMLSELKSEEDKLGMPLRASFNDSYEFYSSLAHEMSHATMKEGRVERDKVSYAYEEMRAEIASTLMCCTLNLPRTQAQVDNHAAYLQPWLEEFSDKKSMLLKAASEAQLIHDYLIDLSNNH